MAALDLKDKWVLVTGASSGLGQAFALTLARDYEANLVLTARRLPQLEHVKQTLEGLGVKALTVQADLSKREGQDALIAALDAHPVSAAILNAGVTHLGDFEDATLEDYSAMLALNTSSIVALSYALLPALKRQSGGLMLVASLGGLTPLPYQSVYAGTKAFALNFGLSLARERATQPASVTVCAPGGIATQMTAAAEFAEQSSMMMPASAVAASTLKAFAARKTLVIPGGQNKIMAFAVKILPRWLVTSAIERSFRRSIARAKAKA